MKHKNYRAPRAGNPIPPCWLGAPDTGHVLQGGPLHDVFFAARYAGREGTLTLPFTVKGETGYYDKGGAWVRCSNAGVDNL